MAKREYIILNIILKTKIQLPVKLYLQRGQKIIRGFFTLIDSSVKNEESSREITIRKNLASILFTLNGKSKGIFFYSYQPMNQVFSPGNVSLDIYGCNPWAQFCTLFFVESVCLHLPNRFLSESNLWSKGEKK